VALPLIGKSSRQRRFPGVCVRGCERVPQTYSTTVQRGFFARVADDAEKKKAPPGEGGAGWVEVTPLRCDTGMPKKS
jgi:hypothetical protein